MRARSSFFVVVSSLAFAACGGQIQGEGEPTDRTRDPSPVAPLPTIPGATPAPAPITPTPPAPAPLACPADGTRLAGATYVTSSIALGTATYHLELGNARTEVPKLLEGVWSGSSHAVSTSLPGTRGMAEVEALSATTWGVSDGFSDAASRNVVVFQRMARVGSFLVPNGSLDRTFLTEGISPDGSRVVFQSGRSVAVAPITSGQDGWQRNARTLCVEDCQLLWAKGDEVLMVRSARGAPSMLIRRSFADLDGPGTEVVDPTAGRSVVAVTKSRIFLDAPYDEKEPVVLDRATLTQVQFGWEGYDDIKAVSERADGSFDVFSVYSGEIASAKHVSPIGTILGEGSGHAAYGRTSVGACGFWVGASLFPFAKDDR